MAKVTRYDPFSRAQLSRAIYDPAPPQEQSGDLVSGAKAGVQSLYGTAAGAVGLLADSANRSFNTDKLTGLRDSALGVYKNTMDNIAANSRDVHHAENVHGFGDAADFAQYWLGYGAANLATGLGSGAITAAAAKQVLKQGIEKGVSRYVADKASQSALQGAALETLKREAAAVSRKEITDRIASRGFLAGMAPQAFIQELGSTYGDAVQKAEANGFTAEDVKLGRVWGYGGLAGLAEFASEGLLAGALRFGPAKDLLSKVTSSKPVLGRVQRGLATSQAEGLTELTQTGLEQMGGGTSYQDANFSDPTSYFAGVIPGGVVGLVRGSAPVDSGKPTDLLNTRVSAARMAETPTGSTVDMFGGDVGDPTRAATVAAERMAATPVGDTVDMFSGDPNNPTPEPAASVDRRAAPPQPAPGQRGLELNYKPQTVLPPTASLQSVINQNVGADRPGANEVRSKESLLNQPTIPDPSNPGAKIPNPYYDPLLGTGRQEIDQKRIDKRRNAVKQAAGERADVGPTGQIGPEPASNKNPDTQTETPKDIGDRMVQIAGVEVPKSDTPVPKSEQKWYANNVADKSIAELDALAEKTASPKRLDIISNEIDKAIANENTGETPNTSVPDSGIASDLKAIQEKADRQAAAQDSAETTPQTTTETTPQTTTETTPQTTTETTPQTTTQQADPLAQKQLAAFTGNLATSIDNTTFSGKNQQAVAPYIAQQLRDGKIDSLVDANNTLRVADIQRATGLKSRPAVKTALQGIMRKLAVKAGTTPENLVKLLAKAAEVRAIPADNQTDATSVLDPQSLAADGGMRPVTPGGSSSDVGQNEPLTPTEQARQDNANSIVDNTNHDASLDNKISSTDMETMGLIWDSVFGDEPGMPALTSLEKLDQAIFINLVEALSTGQVSQTDFGAEMAGFGEKYANQNGQDTQDTTGAPAAVTAANGRTTNNADSGNTEDLSPGARKFKLGNPEDGHKWGPNFDATAHREQVAGWLDPFTKLLAKWVKFDIVESPDSYKGPGVLPWKVKGMYLNGRVTINAYNITSKREAMSVAVHEAIGHLGLAKMLGPKYEHLLDEITGFIKTEDAAVMPVLKQIRETYVNPMTGEYLLTPREEAEEVLAHIAESNPKFGPLRKIWHTIKSTLVKALNKLGMNIPTNDLFIESYLLSSADFIRGNSTAREHKSYGETFHQLVDAMKVSITPIDNTPEAVRKVQNESIDDFNAKLSQLQHILSKRFDVLSKPQGKVIRDTLHKMSDFTQNQDGLSDPWHFNEMEVVRQFLVAGNKTGITDENTYVVHMNPIDNGRYKLTLFLDHKIGPFEGGWLTVDASSSGVEAELTPMEYSSTLAVDGISSDNSIWTGGLMEVGARDDSGNPIYDVGIDGPTLRSDVYKEYKSKTTPAGKPWFTKHSFEVEPGFDYARFGMGALLSNQLNKIAARSLYYSKQENFDVIWYRSTGANPKGKTNSAGETIGKAEKVLRASEVQARYKMGEVMEPEGPASKLWQELRIAYRSMADKSPALLTLHALHDIYGKTMPKLNDYYHRVSEMENMQRNLQKLGHTVAARWDALSKHESLALSRLMTAATLAQIHPDKPLTSPENAHVSSADAGKHAKLSAQYRAMSKEAKEVYTLARDRLRTDWETRGQIYKDLVGATFDPIIAQATGERKAALIKERDQYVADNAKQLATLKGPYFPLKRFGSDLVIYKSAEYKQAEKDVEEAAGPELKAAKARLASMRRNEKHYWVKAFDSARDAMREAAKTPGAKHRFAYERNTKQKDITQQGYRRVADLMDAALEDKGIPREAINSMKGMLADMYVNSLPENHALSSEAKRHYVAGAEPDMLRSFASTIERNAFFMSRLKYNPEVTKELFDLTNQANTQTATEQNVANEVLKRHNLDMQYVHQPYQNFIAKMSGIYHLFSPSYWMVNATQPWFIGAPYLAARYGLGRTMGELRTGMVDASTMVKNMIQNDGLFADLDVTSLSNTNEQEMLQHLIDIGHIDSNITLDLGVIARGDTDVLSKMSRWTMWPAHQVETVNRVMVALAAYRMATTNGMTKNKAIEFADKTVIDTQIDYSNVNAARFMKNGAVPFGKLMFQFRKYQHAMIQLLLMNAKKAYGGDTHARMTLGYLLGAQLVTSGIVGLPLYNVGSMIADALLMDGKDDKRGDAQTQMYNALVKNVGKTMADAVVKGVPAAVFGTDLTKRTGMGYLFSPLPFLRTGGNTGQDVLGNVLVSAGGAPMSLAAAAIDSAKFANSGDWYRAVEVIMPKALKDAGKAYRYSTEGIQTRSGTTGISRSEFSAWDIAQRAMGLTPLRESDYWDAKNAVRTTAAAINFRKQSIRRSYIEAKRGHDRSAARAAIREMAKFNRRHPRFRMKTSDLIRAYRAQRAADTNGTGVNYGRGSEKLKDLVNFANHK